MRIAVAYQDGEIYEHFGHAEQFAVYEFTGTDVENSTKRLIDVRELSGHEAMVERMKAEGIDAVICGNMGPAAKSSLLANGIVPVVGYCGDADTAAELLILGRLPILGGDAGSCGCGGSCGSCGGDCGSGCGGDCGCGC